jgi:regulator of cell morphogenesis and NO signaling
MNVNPLKTVRELAVEVPNATRVFEGFGIDYCCGGKRSLEEACANAGIQLADVTKALEHASAPSDRSQINLASGSLAELIDHIVRTHHKFTRAEINRLQALLDKVVSVHGANHPELSDIRETFHGLAQELTLHLMKEENILFPYIVRMEESGLQGEAVAPPPFATVQNPVRMMMQEHDGAGEALRQIRLASHEFSAPQDACISYQTLYQALQAFEADLHQHIHLENNLLFPRAVEMEEQMLHPSASTR